MRPAPQALVEEDAPDRDVLADVWDDTFFVRDPYTEYCLSVDCFKGYNRGVAFGRLFRTAVPSCSLVSLATPFYANIIISSVPSARFSLGSSRMAPKAHV